MHIAHVFIKYQEQVQFLFVFKLVPEMLSNLEDSRVHKFSVYKILCVCVGEKIKIYELIRKAPFLVSVLEFLNNLWGLGTE